MERWKERVNHSPPSAAPGKVGKLGVLKEAFLQFMLRKPMLGFVSPAYAFSGIKMPYRCKGDCRAKQLPQDY